MASIHRSTPLDKVIYRLSLLSRLFNERGMLLQRQGRIGFFAPSTGQEVAQVASACALEKEDWIFPSYREHAVALARGAAAFDLLNHFMGNAMVGIPTWGARTRPTSDGVISTTLIRYVERPGLLLAKR